MTHPDPPVIEMSESPDVIEVRNKFKSIEDLLDSNRRITNDPEIARAASIAITHCQTASMWSVRALTGGR